MKPADLAIALDAMYGASLKSADVLQMLFEAIDGHDKFSTTPSTAEIRNWLDSASTALEHQKDVHADISNLMDQLEDEREVAK